MVPHAVDQNDLVNATATAHRREPLVVLPDNSPRRAASGREESAALRHRELLRRMAGGDSDALRTLFLELSPQIHGVIRRILPDTEDAREATQDTFVKAWQRAGTYRPDYGAVLSWLVLIARNTAIDRLRKSARRHSLLQTIQRDAEAAATATRLDFDDRDFLSRHLAELTPPQRVALELAFFAGCSPAEIAATMRTPVGNVKNHLRRGLAKLRQLVTRHD
jgi:RNA polymerase sigma-70 factor, ECF subfamily